MSHVTDVLLLTSVLDNADEDAHARESLAKIAAWLAASRGKTPAEIPAARLAPLHPHAAGWKAMQASVYAGAFTGFDIPAFLALVWSLPWEAPDAVQVLIQDEGDEDGWTMYRFGEQAKARHMW